MQSVIEKSELTRIPSLSSYQQGSLQKKCGVSGECGITPDKEVSSDLHKAVQSPPERHNKDFRTRQLIRAALSDNDFLQNLDADQVRDIVDFMFPQKFAPGDYVIREGDQGKDAVHCFHKLFTKNLNKRGDGQLSLNRMPFVCYGGRSTSSVPRFTKFGYTKTWSSIWGACNAV